MLGKLAAMARLGVLLLAAGILAGRGRAAEPLPTPKGEPSPNIVIEVPPVPALPELSPSVTPSPSDPAPASGAAPAAPQPTVPQLTTTTPEEDESCWERWNKQTLGGVIFWGDELFFHDWRIQRHVLTGHCRLLDGENRRCGWGTFEHCHDQLEAIRRERNLPPMSGRAVILVHGLGGVRGTMSFLGDELAKRGYKVFNITYPSTRGDLGQHAQRLAHIVAYLDGIEEISFVGHSMGNLVIRHYLGDCQNPRFGRGIDPRLRRIVMIAPPNHGAEKAREWGDSSLFTAVAGAGALQLGIGWESVEKRLATPPCEFGIIAGGRGDAAGFSDSLPGDDDGLVTVASAQLAGAADFLLLPYRHSMLLISDRAVDATARFIERGYFRSPDERQPLQTAAR